MGYLKFDRNKLVNLEYSLKREVLSTDRAGGYCSTTVICCNTRKYHGLLVVPIAEFGGANHVLLSGVDETIVQHGQAFNLGIHKYPGVYEPRGHKYIQDLEYDPLFSLVFQVGGVMFKKEVMLVHNEPHLMIRYTLLDAHSDTILRLKPFLAFRNAHQLSHANMVANTRHEVIENGIASRLYDGFPTLHMQLSKENEFVGSPDWYYNVEYQEEKNRGYDYREDLFVPGYFEVPIKKGESVIFSASTEKENPAGLKRQFQQELGKREKKDSFESCLRYSASQFIVRDGKDTEVVAGYPWFGRWGRDTFIALPGVTLAASGDVKSCRNVLDTMSGQLRDGLFPNIGKAADAAYNSVDAPLWYFWTLQQYEKAAGKDAKVWKRYGASMRSVLKAYRDGVNEGIRMEENGLVWCGVLGKALTWMDAVVDGVPVTPRMGYAVEINALWYNALRYSLELADKAGDKKFVEEWKDLPARVKDSFVAAFWNPESRYLADYVDETGQNMWVRPNQLLACSLPYSPITDEMKGHVMDVVTRELLTKKGLRTLSPKNENYKGRYEGDQPTRDRAYHQGTVWPWLIGAYIETGLRLYGKQFLPTAKELLAGFEEDMTSYGLCSVAEVYDGNPPFLPGGCISQAWSVGEVLRSLELVKEFEKNL